MVIFPTNLSSEVKFASPLQAFREINVYIRYNVVTLSTNFCKTENLLDKMYKEMIKSCSTPLTISYEKKMLCFDSADETFDSGLQWFISKTGNLHWTTQLLIGVALQGCLHEYKKVIFLQDTS